VFFRLEAVFLLKRADCGYLFVVIVRRKKQLQAWIVREQIQRACTW
jgi:hypothetical protein